MSGHLYWPQKRRLFLLLLLEEGFQSNNLLAKPGNVGHLTIIRWCYFLRGRFTAGWVLGCFRESYAFASLATVIRTEVYAILACSDYCRSANMLNMTICICSDSKPALLGLSLYPILYFYTNAGYHCKISLITTGLDCFGY
jgi:hypothetical protein